TRKRAEGTAHRRHPGELPRRPHLQCRRKRGRAADDGVPAADGGKLTAISSKKEKAARCRAARAVALKSKLRKRQRRNVVVIRSRRRRRDMLDDLKLRHGDVPHREGRCVRCPLRLSRALFRPLFSVEYPHTASFPPPAGV